ncbi:L-serine ammonia-lyase, iron-sulfur-dependent subunit beta [Ruminococcaceae bacterium OttesenSCG-928-L11]|nr:L-serine ammonia-lyase, iron-sulfur-dependent subunit beta [Ruminococcaceae bacterium OttesenSCG-928-L11]
MKAISAFDVIGPNMIGPSSSHTAGAVRIALLTRKLIKGEIRSAAFTLYGSFARTYKGHGTDRALVAGILGFEADDPRIRDSFRHAEARGVAISFSIDTEEREVHPNTVDIAVIDEMGEAITVRGVSTGGGRAEIRAIDGVDVKLSGEYSTIFIRHRDTPGVVAHIAGKLSTHRINIAFMRLYRENKGEKACTIIEADEAIPADVIDQIEAHGDIASAILIQ